MTGKLFKEIPLLAMAVLYLGLLIASCSRQTLVTAAVEPKQTTGVTGTVAGLSPKGTASSTVIPTATATPSQTPVYGEPAILKVMGFKVAHEDQGGPIDQVNKKFLANFQAAYPYITLDLLEIPPETEEQLVTELISGTAPDVWTMDIGILPELVTNSYALDLRQCTRVVPTFDFGRFFPNVLGAYRQVDGSIYGVPDEFSPIMIFYNPALFKANNVPLPQPGWTWDDFIRTAQLLTIDSQGRNRLDPQFDDQAITTWGYRVRKYSFEWIYRLWENGADVLSPDGKTAKGFLDSPESLEALKAYSDLVLKYKIAPPLPVLDQLNRSLSFNERFIQGGVAMFDRGHWDLVVLNYMAQSLGNNIGVAPQPTMKDGTTIFFTSGFFINAKVAADPAKMSAACRFIDAATSSMYQDLKGMLGIAMSANTLSAEKAVRNAQNPERERVFYQAASQARPPYNASIATWPMISQTLDTMMEKILLGNDLAEEVSIAVDEIDLILESH